MPSSKRIIVADTSSIIYLSEIGIIDVLKKLFGEIIIPQAVKKELLYGGEGSAGYKEVLEKKWLKTKKIKNISAKDYLILDIDEGEAEVIILSEEMKADIVIMDDRLGRRIANLRGLSVIGTLRVLVTAKEHGFIKDVKTMLDMLKDKGFWLDKNVCTAVLKKAGEI